MKSTLLPILALLAAAIGGWRLGSGQASQSAGNARPAPNVPAPPPVQPHYNSKEEFLAAEAKAVAEEWSAALSAAATPERMNLLQKPLSHWASVAPADAWRALQRDAHLLTQKEQDSGLSLCFLNIIRSWADHHGWENARQGTSDAPEAWTKGIRRTLGSVLKFQHGAQEILKTLMENPAPDRADILAAVLSAGGTDDFNLPTIEEWKTWLTAQSDPAERETLALAVAASTSGKDPKGSADWLYGLEEARSGKENAWRPSFSSGRPRLRMPAANG